MCNKSNRSLTPEKKELSRTRFFLLILASLLPFGGHFIRHSFSPLQVFYLGDPKLNLDATQYGVMISSSYLPSLFIPLLGGMLIDRIRSNMLNVWFILATTFGQIWFTLSIIQGHFNFAVFGCILMGMGEGLIVTAMRSIVSTVYKNEITFAVGFTRSLSSIAKTLGKATVVPVAIYFGNYYYSLYFTVLVSFFSVVAGIGLYFVKCNYDRLTSYELPDEISSQISEDNEDDASQIESQFNDETTTLLTSQRSFSYSHFHNKKCSEENCACTNSSFWSEVLNDCSSFSARFWLVCILHTIFVMVFHMFSNFSAHFISLKYGKSALESGYISSLSTFLVIFIAPIIGYTIDMLGGQIIASILASLLVLSAYSLFLFTMIDPIIPILLLSCAEAFLPTILLSMVPLTVEKTKYGTAFGIMEVSTSIIGLFGNVVIGYFKDVTDTYFSGFVGLYSLSFIGTLLLLFLQVTS